MDDFELEIEVDDSAFEDIPEGFDLQPITNIDFIENDDLSSDILSDILNSVGSFEFDTATQEEKLLMLEGKDPTLYLETESTIEIDVDEIQMSIEDEAQYEVAISPAQNAIAIYQPQKDESFLIETRNEEIHNAIYDINQYSRSAADKIREYLNTEQFAVIPRTARFLSPQFKKQQDFRSLLVSDFLNHRELPDEYTADHIVAKVFEAYEAEKYPEMTMTERKRMEALVRNFVLYANSVYDEAERMTTLARYEAFPKTIVCPESVGNFTYVCKCGTEYPMPEDRPTLTFLIREIGRAPTVDLMNHTIPCEKCQVYLALPSKLVEAIEIEMYNYIVRIKASYEHPRVYRPKLTDLEQMIPHNVKELFQLSNETVTHESNNQGSKGHNNSFSQYSKLINMWMNSVESKKRLDEVVKETQGSQRVSQVVSQMSLIDFGFVADLYAYQFRKTIIHYLERFANFALTLDTKSTYEYYEIEGLEKKTFSEVYTEAWLYDNSAYIASLNNIYTGDTEVEELNILPEYVEVINYIVTLHLLAKPELMKQGSDLARWLKKPTSNLKHISSAYKKFNPKKKHKIAKSHRDLVNTSKMHPVECWSDTYHFLKHVVSPNRFDPEVSPELRVLTTKATRSSQEDFYGREIPERIIVKPSIMFEEFSEAFRIFGHELFIGAIVDETRKNLALGIELIRKTGKLSTEFNSSSQPVTDISGVIAKKKEYTDKDRARSLLNVAFRMTDLPDELTQKREISGVEAIWENMEEDRELLLLDEDFMKKYGEVLLSYS